MANKVKLIVPGGFLSREVEQADGRKRRKKLVSGTDICAGDDLVGVGTLSEAEAGAEIDVGLKAGSRGGKRKELTESEKRDLRFLKQTYLLENVEEKILAQQIERMSTEAPYGVMRPGNKKELVIPYTPSKHQVEVHNLLREKRFGVVVFHRGAGKRLAVDTWIPRLGSVIRDGVGAGFVRLSDIEAGDILWGSSSETVVLEAHDEVEEEVYRVETRDGVIEACKDHLWQAALTPKWRTKESTFTKYGPKWKVMTTLEMMEAMKMEDVGKVILPRAEGLECDDKAFSIDEYSYGLLLGRQLRAARDQGAGKSMLITKKTIEEFSNRYPKVLLINSSRGNRVYVDHNQAEKVIGLTPGFLRTMDERCIFLSKPRRLELLRGLMDAVGTVFSSGRHDYRYSGVGSTQWGFITTNEQLGKMTYSLVRSLGWRALYYQRFGKTDSHPLHYVIFKPEEVPFKHSHYVDVPLPNKQKDCLIDHYDVVRDIKPTGEKKKMRCLTVDAVDGLFCAGRQFTLTHNTWLAINELIRRAWECRARQGGKFIYIAPEKLQAKKIAWREIKYFLRNIPHTINETELIITLPNMATIELAGADNPDRIRGVHPHFVVMDEVAQMPRDTWYEAVFPALRANNGGALFIGTPKGDNLFRELFDQAGGKHSWFAIKKTIYDTNVATKAQIKEIKESMPQSKFDQEYMCSFEASVQGTYYSDLLEEVSKGIVTDVPWDPTIPVITGWDLGTTDKTIIWFAQKDIHSNNVTRIIDYYENKQEDIFHYINLVQSKPYVYDYHVLPHDVSHVSWETNRSRLSIFKQHGMKVRVAKKLTQQEGISITQAFLYTCRIDASKCQAGIDHLKQYRAKQNKITGEFLDEPFHDSVGHSDAADALRTLAVGIHRGNDMGRLGQSYAISSYDYFNPNMAGRDQEHITSENYDIFEI